MPKLKPKRVVQRPIKREPIDDSDDAGAPHPPIEDSSLDATAQRRSVEHESRPTEDVHPDCKVHGCMSIVL
jgi:hypothetical protein